MISQTSQNVTFQVSPSPARRAEPGPRLEPAELALDWGKDWEETPQGNSPCLVGGGSPPGAFETNLPLSPPNSLIQHTVHAPPTFLLDSQQNSQIENIKKLNFEKSNRTQKPIHKNPQKNRENQTTKGFRVTEFIHTQEIPNSVHHLPRWSGSATVPQAPVTPSNRPNRLTKAETPQEE